MYVLGGLLLVGGLCCAGMGAILPAALEQQPELMAEIEAAGGGQITPELLQTIYVAAGIGSLVYAITMIVSAVFVRRGGAGGVIVGMILTGVGALGLLVLAIMGVVEGNVVGAACVAVVPMALLILLLVWLIQALKAAPQVAQAQWAAGQQQQQGQWQQGYAAPQPYWGGPQSPYHQPQPQQTPQPSQGWEDQQADQGPITYSEPPPPPPAGPGPQVPPPQDQDDRTGRE